MRRLLLVVFGVLGVLLVAGPAGACSPCPRLTDAEKLQQAQLVVVGVVSDLDSIFVDSATVQVEEVVKGQGDEEIEIVNRYGNPCLSELSEGHRYRLYLYQTHDGWAQTSCPGAEQQSAVRVLAWWRIHNECAAVIAVGLVLVIVRTWRRRAAA